MHTILVYDSGHGYNNHMESDLQGTAQLTFISDQKEFQDQLNILQYDLIVIELEPPAEHALVLLEDTQKKCPYTPVIITSSSEKAELVVRTMNRGASDFLIHPVSKERITLALERSIEIRNQKFEIDYLRRKQDVVYDFKDVVAVSACMKDILQRLERFSRTDSTILITGDTGTGKSFLSGTVHFNSPRKKKPFVKINCANIPENLLESELFGHEKGAFTGADKQRIGRFEQANGGTIFLDEIGEISLSLQTKLLRVLEEKAFERVGGNRTIYADVRIIAATNKDLLRQIEEGLFREDLYYRINVLPVRLPPLREREKCIIPLAEVLLEKLCKSLKRRDITGFSKKALIGIQAYPWPGNIRQLANTIERAVILEDDSLIHEHSLSMPSIRSRQTDTQQAKRRGEADPAAAAEDEGSSLATQERDLIRKTLEECLWVQKEAALKLQISPRALNYKISRMGITHPHWRRNKA
ncbi:MAG: sigma-54 dependent transcriptional regulator [Desulfocapsaceae bacterium]|nr:sigma-54 dependent transcriptional regulator [Desulfocapsaceae bacterium]